MTNPLLPPGVSVDVSKGVEPSGINPANPLPAEMAADVDERTRVPVSAGRAKLKAPEIPGYSLYWFLERNVQAALQGGYRFVSQNETVLNQHGLANALTDSGNTDLGTRVSIGSQAGNGPEKLFLMKIKLEWFKKDQLAIASENARIMEAIFQSEKVVDPATGQELYRPGQVFGQSGAGRPADNVYMNTKPLFQRPVRKAR